MSNPALPLYQAKPVPTGVSAALTGCTWQPTAGGQVQSEGTLTSRQSSAHTWTLTMIWLQNGRELARQTGTVSLAPGETKSWGLATASGPPADPFGCALEVS
jgi:hypothetical protein